MLNCSGSSISPGLRCRGSPVDGSGREAGQLRSRLPPGSPSRLGVRPGWAAAPSQHFEAQGKLSAALPVTATGSGLAPRCQGWPGPGLPAGAAPSPRNDRSAARAAAGRGLAAHRGGRRRAPAFPGGRGGAARPSGRRGLGSPQPCQSPAARLPGAGPARQPLHPPCGSVTGLPFRRELRLAGRGRRLWV